MTRQPTLALVVAAALSCARPQPAAPTVSADAGPARILDVFFGLDHALPFGVNRLCLGGSGLDGIPVTFSRRVKTSPPGAAFRVTTRSGQVRTPRCATLAPADERMERFTVLLIGDLGTAADPPARVDVIGSVPFDGGEDALGLGSTAVTPLEAGPSLLLALRHTPADLDGAAGTRCPPATKQIVLAVWEGGVTDTDGAGLGDAALPSFHVTVRDADGSTRDVSPIGLGGTGDHDNFVHVCLGDPARPVKLAVDPGVAFDPRRDPNPATSVVVTNE